MSNENPMVSVIMPVCNGELFLGEAIKNIRKQEYDPIEIILIDDGSTDQTAEIAARLEGEIQYIYQSNQGPAAARNIGLKLAKGRYISFLDVDDLWADNMLQTQIDFLKNHQDSEIAQGYIQDLESVDTPGSEKKFEKVEEPYYYVNLGSAVYRREVFEKVGLFDESLRFNEDTDWFIRAWDYNITKAKTGIVALYYRRHEDNMTNRKNSWQIGLARLFKKHLDRKRGKGNVNGRQMIQERQSFFKYIGREL